MNRLLIPLFFLLVGASSPIWARPAADVDSLLTVFEEKPVAAVANQFFDQLYSEQLTDERLHFPANTHPDTLRQQVFYWAAEYCYAQQHYDRAIGYGQRSLPLCRAGHNRQMEADCLNVLSIAFLRKGDPKEAAHYAKECYELDLRSGNPDNISSSLNTLAAIYLGANMPQEAEQYVLQGIDYCRRAANELRLATLYGMASEVYHALDNQQLALDYARKALDIDQRLNLPDRVAMRQSLMAAALVAYGRYDQAEECLNAAIPVLQQSGNYHSLAIAYNKMGELQIHKEQNDKAIAYFSQAAQIFEAMGDPYNELHSQLGLYNALKDSLPNKAQEHIFRYTALKDSLYSQEAAKTMGRLSAEMEVDDLKAQNSANLSRARVHLIIVIGLVVVLIIAVSLLFWLLHRRTRRFVSQFNGLSTDFEQLSEQYEKMKKAFSPNAPASPSGAEGGALGGAAMDEDAAFLAHVNTIISRQIGEGHVDVGALATEMCMSLSAFRRRFSSLVDERPQAYVMRLRMDKARQLLGENPDATIADIGMRLGFDDKSNFTRAFKRVYGITPSEYVKSIKQPDKSEE